MPQLRPDAAKVNKINLKKRKKQPLEFRLKKKEHNEWTRLNSDDCPTQEAFIEIKNFSFFHTGGHIGGNSHIALFQDAMHPIGIYFQLPIISKFLKTLEKNVWQDFPGGTVVKNPPADAGDMGSSPGPGRSHMPRSN